METVKINKTIEKTLWLFVSAIITIALHLNIQLVVLKKEFLDTLFSSFCMTDIFVCVSIFFMVHYVKEHDKNIDIWSLMLAIIFSFLYLTSRSYQKFSNLIFFTQNKMQACLSAFCIISFSMLFYLSLRVIYIYIELHKDYFISTKYCKIIENRFLLYSFIFISICWIFYLLIDYPGWFSRDAQWQLMQFFGASAFTSHHPPLATCIMGSCVAIGRFLGNSNFGCFLYLLLQILIVAWVFSFGIKKLYLIGLKLKYCIIAILFFGLTPFWGCFAQWFEKDFLYTGITTLFLIYVIDIVVKKSCSRKEMFCLFATGLVASLLRHNGIYAVIPTLFVLIFYLRNSSKRMILISFCGILFTYMFVVKIFYPSILGIEKGSIREALSIPFQQTARYVKEYENEVTEYEKKVIDTVLDYNSLAFLYDPKVSDPVKDTYKEDDLKLPEYFKVWFQMLLKHPAIYISTFFNGAYGYLAPVETSIEPKIIPEDNHSYYNSIGMYKSYNNLGIKLYSCLRGINMYVPLIRYLCMPGFFFWIMFICIVALLKRKLYSPLIIFILEFMNLLVCIASPLADSLRYALPTAAAIPFILGITLYFLCKETVPLTDPSKEDCSKK